MAIRDLTLQLRDDHAEARARRAAASAASSPASTRWCRSRAPPTSGCRWKTTDDRSSARSKRLRTLVAGIDNVYFNIKSRAALVLPGAAVARRPPRRAGDRGGRAQRRQLARRRRRSRRRRRLLHLPRPLERRRAAVGHHRRRHEGQLLPRASSRRARARSGRCRPSARRRTRACCRSSSRPSRSASRSAAPRSDQSSRRPRPEGALPRRASRPTRRTAPRIPGTPAESAREACSCAVVSPIGRSSAKLRRSPLTVYVRAGNVTLRPPCRRGAPRSRSRSA